MTKKAFKAFCKYKQGLDSDEASEDWKELEASNADRDHLGRHGALQIEADLGSKKFERKEQGIEQRVEEGCDRVKKPKKEDVEALKHLAHASTASSSDAFFAGKWNASSSFISPQKAGKSAEDDQDEEEGEGAVADSKPTADSNYMTKVFEDCNKAMVSAKDNIALGLRQGQAKLDSLPTGTLSIENIGSDRAYTSYVATLKIRMEVGLIWMGANSTADVVLLAKNQLAIVDGSMDEGGQQAGGPELEEAKKDHEKAEGPAAQEQVEAKPLVEGLATFQETVKQEEKANDDAKSAADSGGKPTEKSTADEPPEESTAKAADARDGDKGSGAKEDSATDAGKNASDAARPEPDAAGAAGCNHDAEQQQGEKRKHAEASASSATTPPAKYLKIECKSLGELFEQHPRKIPVCNKEQLKPLSEMSKSLDDIFDIGFKEEVDAFKVRFEGEVAMAKELGAALGKGIAAVKAHVAQKLARQSRGIAKKQTDLEKKQLADTKVQAKAVAARLRAPKSDTNQAYPLTQVQIDSFKQIAKGAESDLKMQSIL